MGVQDAVGGVGMIWLRGVRTSSHTSTWECACLTEDDHAVVTGDVAFHQDLDTLETSQAIM